MGCVPIEFSGQLKVKISKFSVECVMQYSQATNCQGNLLNSEYLGFTNIFNDGIFDCEHEFMSQ